MRAICIVAAICAACGGKKEQAPAAGSASADVPRDAATLPQTLTPIAYVRDDVNMITGTNRFALHAGDAWFASSPTGIVAQPAVGQAIAAQLQEVGGVVADVLYGATPIVVGGKDHQERHVRVGATIEDVKVHGIAWEAVQVGDIELWHTEHRIRTELAWVDARGATELPAFRLAGPKADAASPVSGKACESPRIADIASNGKVAVALLVECHPDAPVRIAWIEPSETRVVEVPAAKLAFTAQRIAIGRDASDVAIAGTRDDRLGILRIGQPTDVATRTFPARRVFDAAIDDAGAVWTLSSGVHDGSRVIARDGVPVALSATGATTLVPEGLGYDSHLGIAVLASIPETKRSVVLVQRPPAGGVVELDAR